MREIMNFSPCIYSMFFGIKIYNCFLFFQAYLSKYPNRKMAIQVELRRMGLGDDGLPHFNDDCFKYVDIYIG